MKAISSELAEKKRMEQEWRDEMNELRHENHKIYQVLRRQPQFSGGLPHGKNAEYENDCRSSVSSLPPPPIPPKSKFIQKADISRPMLDE